MFGNWPVANCNFELRCTSGTATIEAMRHPGFFTQTLLDSITVPHIMAVELSRARAHGDMVVDHFSAIRICNNIEIP